MLQNNYSVSYGNKITDSQMAKKPFREVLEEIKSNRHSGLIGQIRNILDIESKKDLKKTLPHFSVCTFNNDIRKNDNFQSTDFLLYDIDHLNGRKEQVKSDLKLNDSIYCVFDSPSGDGLKVIMRLDKSIISQEDYRKVYNHYKTELSNKYNIPIDNTVDPARTCFLSHDPDLYLNENAVTLSTNVLIQDTTFDSVTDSTEPVTYVVQDLEEAVKCLKGAATTYDEWTKLGFALASIGEEGRGYFIDISNSHPVHQDNLAQINEKFSELLQSYKDKTITIGTLFFIAAKYGYIPRDKKFWFVENSKIKVNRSDFLRFLENNGFGKQYYENNDYTFLRIKDNIISEVTEPKIKDFVLEYIRGNKANLSKGLSSNALEDYMLNPSSGLFSRTFLEGLKELKPSFNKDKENKAYFYFNNCFVEVTKDNIVEKDYSSLSGFVWKNQMLKRDYKKASGNTDFKKFVSNICKGNPERIKALESALGYLLHSYKNPTLVKSIIFTDEDISDDPKGRTGKTLCIKAIGHLKNVSVEDGRNFNFNSKFAFQQVNPYTQVISFDDCNQNFEFDKLFSILTTGITIEKKHFTSYSVPYSESPKVVLSTNHTIKGLGGSAEARKFEVEFSSHYNSSFSPLNEFDKMFFDGWTSQDWNEFDSYMLSCCQLFLTEGLVNYKHINLNEKKLTENTSEDFIEFMSGIEQSVQHIKKDKYQDFLRDYPGNNNVKQNTFTKWIKSYCNMKSLKYSEKRSNGQTNFTISPSPSPIIS